MYKIKELEKIVVQIRRDILRMVHANNSGHPGGSLGCVEFFTALYFEVMNQNSSFNMDGINEDLFFLSNGHISPVYYSILARSGYFDVSELSTFRKINSRLQGHPTTHENLEGVRIASGSLGQGLSVAIGAAETKKLNNDSNIVFSLHGDGELQEGQVWEALMYAPKEKLDNLICFIDYNGGQSEGSPDDIMPIYKNLHEKISSFDWHCQDIDGHNLMILNHAIKTPTLKPKCIILNTVKGKGVSFIEEGKWHSSIPNEEQYKQALKELFCRKKTDF